MSTVAILPDRMGSLANSVVNSTSSAISAPAGISGKVIRVYRLFLVVGGATNLTFEDGSNALCGPLPILANGSIVLDIDGSPWFTTTSGNAFTIANSGSVQVSGAVYYYVDNA